MDEPELTHFTPGTPPLNPMGFLLAAHGENFLACYGIYLLFYFYFFS